MFSTLGGMIIVRFKLLLVLLILVLFTMQRQNSNFLFYKIKVHFVCLVLEPWVAR